MIKWTDWIGLPHEIGADPREGKAACCLVMTFALHESIGTPMPPFNRDWLDMARRGQWVDLHNSFKEWTVPLERAHLYSLIPLTLGGKFGIGIMVENNLILAPHHRRGVIAVPSSLMPAATFHWPHP